MINRSEKSELRQCLSGLGFKFRKNKNRSCAMIPKNVSLCLEDQTIKIVVSIHTEDKDVPNVAVELQINGFSISFQKLEQYEITLSKRIKTNGYKIEIKNNSIYINN
ncbi:MAG: hypothetical protein WA063_01695 [Minisyncoccia bacterium]